MLAKLGVFGVLVALLGGAAGCSRAQPTRPDVSGAPSGSATRQVIRMAPVWPQVERYCRLAATRTAMAIPCPTIAPTVARPRSHWVMCRGSNGQLEGAGCSRQTFLLEEHFKGPVGYSGIPGPHGPLRLGHLAIWTTRITADDGAELRGPCPSPRLLATGDTAGRAGNWYYCRTGGLNAGHLAFVWTIDRVVYGVSVHRNSPVNRRLVERIVAMVSLVRGSAV